MSSTVCMVRVCMLESIFLIVVLLLWSKAKSLGFFKPFYKSWVIFFINISRSRRIRILIVYCIWQKITQHFFFSTGLLVDINSNHNNNKNNLCLQGQRNKRKTAKQAGHKSKSKRGKLGGDIQKIKRTPKDRTFKGTIQSKIQVRSG